MCCQFATAGLVHTRARARTHTHTHTHRVCVLRFITLPFSPMVICVCVSFQIESERVKNKKEYRLSLYIVQTGRIQRTRLLLKEKELLYPYSLIIKTISGQHFELCPHLHSVSTKTTAASRTVTLPCSSSSNQRGTFPAQKRLCPLTVPKSSSAELKLGQGPTLWQALRQARLGLLKKRLLLAPEPPKLRLTSMRRNSFFQLKFKFFFSLQSFLSQHASSPSARTTEKKRSRTQVSLSSLLSSCTSIT